jgi:hypothetical protein
MKKDSRKKTKKSDENKPLEVKPVKMKTSEMDCDFEFKKGTAHFTFGVNRDYLRQIKSKGDLLVLTETREPPVGASIIVQSIDETFLCGTLEKDKLTKILYFKDSADENAFPLMLDELIYCGEIIGYCPLTSETGITEKKLKFAQFAGKGKR